MYFTHAQQLNFFLVNPVFMDILYIILYIDETCNKQSGFYDVRVSLLCLVRLQRTKKYWPNACINNARRYWIWGDMSNKSTKNAMKYYYCIQQYNDTCPYTSIYHYNNVSFLGGVQHTSVYVSTSRPCAECCGCFTL